MRDDVFISYSREDKEDVLHIVDALRQQNVTIWMDNLLEVGDAWRMKLSEAIEKASTIIVMMSPSSKQSNWVDKEIAYAENWQKPIIPILVKGKGNTAIPLSLVNIQYVDARVAIDSAVNQVARKLKLELQQTETVDTQLIQSEHFDVDFVNVDIDEYSVDKLRQISDHIGKHYLSKIKPNGLKGLIFVSNNQEAIAIKRALDSIVGAESVAVFVSATSDDSTELSKYYRTLDEDLSILKSYKQRGAEPGLIITIDRLTTGFDAPIITSLYMAKSATGYDLMQILARVMRLYKNKDKIFIVDYVGISDEVRKLLSLNQEATSESISDVIKTNSENQAYDIDEDLWDNVRGKLIRALIRVRDNQDIQAEYGVFRLWREFSESSGYEMFHGEIDETAVSALESQQQVDLFKHWDRYSYRTEWYLDDAEKVADELMNTQRDIFGDFDHEATTW